MAECIHDCGSCGEDCSKRDFQVAPHKDSKIKKVIGIISGKGGVGKSLVTTLLASRVNKDGFKTLLLRRTKNQSIIENRCRNKFGMTHYNEVKK